MVEIGMVMIKTDSMNTVGQKKIIGNNKRWLQKATFLVL